MVTIAKNPYYHIQVDKAKNRIFFKIKGGWSHEAEVPQFIEHWKEAISYIRPGFFILSDIREAKEHTPQVRHLHIQAQRMLIEAGLAQIAEVHSLNEPGSDHAIDLAQESKIPLNIFDNLQDAEAWLAEVDQDQESKN
ncbi:MAG: hypothetical protein ACO1OQ_02870 [Rufibacter sp.]